MVAYRKLRENVRMRLGGRHDIKLLDIETFDTVFPPEHGFFIKSPHGDGHKYLTYLADYLELSDYI
jgi:hypothetical protein